MRFNGPDRLLKWLAIHASHLLSVRMGGLQFASIAGSAGALLLDETPAPEPTLSFKSKIQAISSARVYGREQHYPQGVLGGSRPRGRRGQHDQPSKRDARHFPGQVHHHRLKQRCPS